MRQLPLRAIRDALKPSNGTAGSLDRVHNGLVSGWLVCPECANVAATRPELLVGGSRTPTTCVSTPRPDVPGGLGFLLRFAPVRIPLAFGADPGTEATVRCADHPGRSLVTHVAPVDWEASGLGSIEVASWPVVSGWFARLDETALDPELLVGGSPTVPVRPTVRRSDVESFLGAVGVGGFHIDLGAILGYAMPDGTDLRLVQGTRVLAQGTVTGSPLGVPSDSCIDGRLSGWLDEDRVADLRRRFESAVGPPPVGHWRNDLAGLGFEEYSAEVEQWAALMAHWGMGIAEIVEWLTLRAVAQLGVPALDPRPRTLALDGGGPVPGQVAAWGECLIPTPLAPRPRAERLGQASRSGGLVDGKVVVAGLVNHGSGLGQNARHSVRAVELAGLHACAAPFFPERGGWNPFLGPSKEALDAMADHAVLLHVPVDRVVASLAAQPALLASDRMIGYFMWETAVVPPQFRRALDLMDEVWTASEFVAEAYRSVSDTPVVVTGHAVDVSDVEHVSRASLGIDEDAFVVHFAFDANSTVARKNPSGVLDAFEGAFGADPSAVLVLKVRNMQQAEWLARSGDPHARGFLERLAAHRGIRLITGEHTHARALGLIQMADCYISLHRSEGYGYGVAEAMALGTPVVATDYSGSRVLTENGRAWLVAATQIQVLPGEYFYWAPDMSWAEPEVDAAATQLWNVRWGGASVSERVDAARAWITANASMTTLSARYADALAFELDGEAHD